MISEAALRGGAVYEAISADRALSPRGARIRAVHPLAGNLGVVLPDARKLRAGGPAFAVFNLGYPDLLVKDHTGAAIDALVQWEAADVYLIDSTTEAGSWCLFRRNPFHLIPDLMADDFERAAGPLGDDWVSVSNLAIFSAGNSYIKPSPSLTGWGECTWHKQPQFISGYYRVHCYGSLPGQPSGIGQQQIIIARDVGSVYLWLYKDSVTSFKIRAGQVGVGYTEKTVNHSLQTFVYMYWTFEVWNDKVKTSIVSTSPGGLSDSVEHVVASSGHIQTATLKMISGNSGVPALVWSLDSHVEAA